jgi:hypothetical protein
VAWNGFLGVGDPVSEPLPRESLARLREITHGRGESGTADARRRFVNWIAEAIDPRNVAGLANPERRNLYPVDFDALIERHALLGLSRPELLASLPALRAVSPVIPRSEATRNLHPASLSE